MRRWIKVSVAAAVVLGIGGYAAEPYARDWMLAGSACGGALPRDVVDRLTPDGAHLEGEESRQTGALGSYGCDLTMKGDEVDDSRLISMEAYTRRDDRDREFFRAFPEEGFSSQSAVPEGLPGFIDRLGVIQLLMACPDLPKGGRASSWSAPGWAATRCTGCREPRTRRSSRSPTRPRTGWVAVPSRSRRRRATRCRPPSGTSPRACR
ncbi:hypothetical protein [Streptomyces sp. NPDC050988]|uniref:hypothetical protein n=1 Tax=Streptomyces sp. NPDC050988 TaxID=3365637 RepID=UPI003790B272